MKSANTGTIPGGYMNMGIWGIVVNSLLFSFAFGWFDKINIDERYFGVLFIFFVAIQNSSMLTVLLTHGLLVALFVFSVLKLGTADRSNT